MFQIKSFAKLNLALIVNGKETEKGYHTLTTFMCILKDYYDVLEIKPAKKFELKIHGGQSEDKGFSQSNILTKVANLFTKEFKKHANFEVTLRKNIKIAAGLGGASSNAGAFLNFLLAQHNIFLNKKAYSQFAMKVGADVAFFYDNSPKICTHFGEDLHEPKFEMPNNLYALLVLPEFGLKTVEVFSNFKPEWFATQELNNFNKVLTAGNSLTQPACILKPELEIILNKLQNLPNVLKAGLSGSGSVCFAIFEGLENAQNATKFMEGELLISRI